MDIQLCWRAYGGADENTEYKILSDMAEPGTFVELDTVEATDRGDSEYSPFTTALAANLGIGDTLVVLNDGSDFDGGMRIKIGGETIILGSADGNSFGNCTRGADGTVRRPHAADAPVYAMHESYLHEDVNFILGEGEDAVVRHVIRYQVVAVLGTVELVAAEAIAVNPGLPPTNDLTVIWGVLDTLTNQPASGTTVSVSLAGSGIFNVRTAEALAPGSQSTMTDADGYWELVVPRNTSLSTPGALQLSIGNQSHPLREIPDVDSICYLECI